jgi:hypothetical protein
LFLEQKSEKTNDYSKDWLLARGTIDTLQSFNS